jgi:AraC-like DNA-binding protein
VRIDSNACAPRPGAHQEALLYRGALFNLGEFRCPPGDARWQQANAVGARPVVAFAATSVVIRHDRHEPVLANANHAVFYRAGESYRRALHDPRGDRCIYVGFDPGFAVRLLRSAGVKGADFPITLGPTRPHLYLGLRTAALALGSGTADSLAVDEAVCLIVGSAIEDGMALRGARSPRRRTTARQHHQLVEGAKHVLTERTCANDSLSSIARSLHSSEFHLARVFHGRTGFTLHAYRTQLRLRSALDELARPGTDLGALGICLGFNSHSHFTGSFRASFGVPPSKIRTLHGRRGLRELRKILEARLARAS